MRILEFLILLTLAGLLFAGCGQPPPVAVVPPIIHDVQASFFRSTGVTIHWQTDRPTSSRIDYTIATDPQITVARDDLETVHSLTASLLTTPQPTTVTITAVDDGGLTSQYTLILPRTSPIFDR